MTAVAPAQSPVHVQLELKSFDYRLAVFATGHLKGAGLLG